MSNTVKVPVQLWEDIKTMLVPHARRLMNAKGMYDEFPELYAIMTRIEDLSSAEEIDPSIFGIPTIKEKEPPFAEMAEVLNEAIEASTSETPEWVPDMLTGYYEELPSSVKDALNDAQEDRPFSTDNLFNEEPTVEPAPEVKVTDYRNACAIIMELFNSAVAKGAKRVTYRSPVLTLSRAPDTGSNPGMVYLRDRDNVYVGKMNSNNVFFPRFRESKLADAEIYSALFDIANDPKAVAIKYGRITGTCCVCGIELTDPVSVKNGIGPICAEKFGW